MSLVMDSGRRQAPAVVGLGSLRQARLPGKYRHGLALGPRADELAEVLIRLDSDRAVELLVGWSREGTLIDEIEEEIIAPALTKIGEMWIRGRVEGSRFAEIGGLAEGVERQFRRAIGLRTVVRRTIPAQSTA